MEWRSEKARLGAFKWKIVMIFLIILIDFGQCGRRHANSAVHDLKLI